MARIPSLPTAVSRLTAARAGRNAVALDEAFGEYSQSVDSSAISTVGYSEQDQTLQIKFLRSGRTYTYYGVPLSVYRQITQASSPGRYFNANIRNHYRFS
jgi:hypothetical protein